MDGGDAPPPPFDMNNESNDSNDDYYAKYQKYIEKAVQYGIRMGGVAKGTPDGPMGAPSLEGRGGGHHGGAAASHGGVPGGGLLGVVGDAGIGYGGGGGGDGQSSTANPRITGTGFASSMSTDSLHHQHHHHQPHRPPSEFPSPCGSDGALQSPTFSHPASSTSASPVMSSALSLPSNHSYPSNDTVTVASHPLIPKIDKLFPCPFCASGFDKQMDLIEHKKTHREDKPFQCQYCASCFSQLIFLEIHEKVRGVGFDKLFCCCCCCC